MTGTAAQIVYGVTKDLTKVAGAVAVVAGASMAAPVTVPDLAIGGTALLYGLNTGIQQTQELFDKGVDLQTAKEAGSVHGLVGGVSVLLPGGFAMKRVASVAAGGGIAAASYMAEQTAINQILTQASYEKQAEEFNPFDPVGLGVSAAFGGVVGAICAKPRTRVPLGVEDAARIRAGEANKAGSMAEDLDDGAQVSRGFESFQTARAAVDTGKRPGLNENSVNAKKLKEIQEESAKRLQERNANNEKVLQNRDRSSASSIAQMASIAGSPDYGRLGFSRTFTDDAAVVVYAADIPEVQRGRRDYLVAANGKRYEVQYAVVEADQIATSNSVDGTVNPEYGTGLQVTTAIAGNGRAAGLKAAYERGIADNYRVELTADNV